VKSTRREQVKGNKKSQVLKRKRGKGRLNISDAAEAVLRAAKLGDKEGRVVLREEFSKVQEKGGTFLVTNAGNWYIRGSC